MARICCVCESDSNLIYRHYDIGVCSKTCKSKLKCLSCGTKVDDCNFMCKLCTKERLATNENDLKCAQIDALVYLEEIGVKFLPGMMKIQKKSLLNVGFKVSSCAKNIVKPSDSADCKNAFLLKNTLSKFEKKKKRFLSAGNLAALEFINVMYVPAEAYNRSRFFDANNFNFRIASTKTAKRFDNSNARVYRIELVRGTGYNRLVGSLVHEYLHAWIFLYRAYKNCLDIDTMNPPNTCLGNMEESLCILVSCLYWQKIVLENKASLLSPVYYKLIRKITQINKYKRQIDKLNMLSKKFKFLSVCVSVATGKIST